MSSDDRITRYTGALRALGYGSDLVEARRVSDHRGVRYVVSVDGYTDDMRAVYWSSGRLELTGGDGPWGDMPEDPLPPELAASVTSVAIDMARLRRQEDPLPTLTARTLTLPIVTPMPTLKARLDALLCAAIAQHRAARLLGGSS